MRHNEEWLRRFYAEIFEVKRILFAEGQTVKGAKRLLRKMRDRWVQRLLRSTNLSDDKDYEILGAWCNKTDNYWPGLFHCYSDPRIPGTNNGMEIFIKEIKQLERHLSQNPNPATRVIRHAATNAIATTRPELPGKEFLARCSPQLIAQAEASLKAKRKTLGAARYARRNIDAFAENALERWRRASRVQQHVETSHE